jgi:hypothetical protein
LLKDHVQHIQVWTLGAQLQLQVGPANTTLQLDQLTSPYEDCTLKLQPMANSEDVIRGLCCALLEAQCHANKEEHQQIKLAGRVLHKDSLCHKLANVGDLLLVAEQCVDVAKKVAKETSHHTGDCVQDAEACKQVAYCCLINVEANMQEVLQELESTRAESRQARQKLHDLNKWQNAMQEQWWWMPAK